MFGSRSSKLLFGMRRALYGMPRSQFYCVSLTAVASYFTNALFFIDRIRTEGWNAWMIWARSELRTSIREARQERFFLVNLMCQFTLLNRSIIVIAPEIWLNCSFCLIQLLRGVERLTNLD